MSNRRKLPEYAAQKRALRKQWQASYQSLVNRTMARAIAFNAKSEKGVAAWRTYVSLSSSLPESDTQSST